ncbi:MAG: hypothetical protein ACLVJ6_07680 [Merdibacter sp.]
MIWAKVLRKGGNSQFTSADCYSKYNAVLAISETHDCKIDVTQAALHILAQWLLDKRNFDLPPVAGYSAGGFWLRHLSDAQRDR